MSDLATPTPARPTTAVIPSAARSTAPSSEDDNGGRADLAVSQQTLVVEPTKSRRYFSPARYDVGVERKRKLYAAAIELIQGGNYRPTSAQLAKQAGSYVHAVPYYFGSQELFWRELARNRWQDIARLARLDHLEEREQQRLVWLIMTGTRKELP